MNPDIFSEANPKAFPSFLFLPQTCPAAKGMLYTHTDYPGAHIYDFSHVAMQFAAMTTLQSALGHSPR